MKTKIQKRLEKTALRASEAASAIIVKYYGKNFRVREKTGAGIVTEADLKAEEAIIRILQKDFPEMGILAEESGIVGRSMERGAPGRWIIDPIDGTTNFAHGYPMFCVSIAAEWEHEITVGVIQHPILNDIYQATRGHGAKLNGKPMKVSKVSRMKDSLLTTGFSYKSKGLLKTELHLFEVMSIETQAVRRPGSAALDLAYTARGVFDGFWEMGLSPWDIAAGALLVEEAGGKATDLRGNKLGVLATQVLASNKKLHGELLRQIRY